MRKLNRTDVLWVLRRMPAKVRATLESHGVDLFVAGGFIRACISHEAVSDIDLFVNSPELANVVATELSGESNKRHTSTVNAHTVWMNPPVQIIHRWTFDNPVSGIESFDFTIVQCAIWFNKELKAWDSVCANSFYEDLAASRLIYTSPKRIEEAGGSLLRVLKYYQRGYRIPLKDLSAVVARLLTGIHFTGSVTDGGRWEPSEEWLAQVTLSLLLLVDPLTDLENKAAIVDTEPTIEEVNVKLVGDILEV